MAVMRGLSDGYGVVVGTKVSFSRDDPNNFGKYHHGNLMVQAGANRYRCAIGIDSGSDPNGHKWCTFALDADDLANIRQLDNGWHELASNSISGALDYIRTSSLRRKIAWVSGDDKAAIAALEAFVIGVGIGETGSRYFVFGEPFRNGFGVHNVHQNQGSEIGGGHDAENGVWQDGGLLVERSGSMVAFLNRFSNQADATDQSGSPT